MVLLIDDNKDLIQVLCELLGISGYEATAAFNGEEGLLVAKDQKPEVILCDIGMTGMNGYEVAKHIRRDAELKDVYLIAMSGYSSQRDLERSIEAGFDRHLNKPIAFDVLKAAVAEGFTK